MQGFAHDVRFAFRQLYKNLGFTFTAICVLALGMCACVAIFAFVDAALIKPLPYRDPNRLVGVTESAGKIPRANLSYLDYLDWKKANTVFSSFDALTGAGYMLTTPTGTDLVRGVRVTDGFFRTLGVSPILGRDFYAGESEPAAAHTVILSYATWKKRFAGGSDAIGKTVVLSGVPYTVIGVLPREFQFAPRSGAEFWATMHDPNSCEQRRSCHNLIGIARLKDGVSVAAAYAKMASVAAQLEKQYPDSNRGQGAVVDRFYEWVVGDVRPIVLTLLGGAALLFLMACINVASLLLARSESRRREMAVRNALGASAARLMRQFATEGLVLVALATVLGVAAADWAMRLLTALIPTEVMDSAPFFQGLGLNLRVIAFAAVLAALSAALFSFAPMLRLSLPGMGIREGLAEGGRSAAGTMWRRFGSNLVTVELAIAMVLLAGAGLLGKSFYRLLQVNLGFQPDHLATLTVALPPLTYKTDAQQAVAGRELVRRVSALPGVISAAITMQLPVTQNGNTTWIRLTDAPYNGEHNEVLQRDVSPRYFSTLQAKLARGRYFTETDDAAHPNVVIINKKLAQIYYPNQDPIGHKLGDTTLSEKSLVEIVGVVDDIREGPLDQEIWPAVYYPSNQNPDSDFSLVVRTKVAPSGMMPSLVAAVHSLDPAIGTRDEATMEQLIHDSSSAYLHRSSAWLVGGFAALALLLSVIGLYGVIAYGVSQRTREIGVRMALGAQRGAVHRLILKESGSLVLRGIVIGVLCSIASAMLLRRLLFGTSAWDLPTFAAVIGVLAGSALLASYLPARSAASVNPVDALRAE